MKTAFITGITGQDGAYLAQLLLSKNYHVFGLQRRSSNFLDSRWRLRTLGIEDRITYVEGDITDAGSLAAALRHTEPDEVYNLAAQSFVHASWAAPNLAAQTTGVGALNLFDTCRRETPNARIYQAGSSEMFGKVPPGGCPQNETTPFHPRSPYGVAKCFAHHAAVNYRESYGMFIANGILFNHESPLRGEEFVTRKVCRGAARIARGQQTALELGNLEARRDWGHAADYVEGMWLMLQQKEPQDFVLATGQTRSIHELCAEAFGYFGLDYTKYVVKNLDFYRPAEVDVLLGDPAKAEELLGWSRRYAFKALIAEMVEAEYGRTFKESGA